MRSFLISLVIVSVRFYLICRESLIVATQHTQLSYCGFIGNQVFLYLARLLGWAWQ
ncbi:hypothetical protein DsansV1_C02g0016931 [Dioscorea sansibarensis]